MLDYAEYTIDNDGYQDNGHNGYDKLDGDWLDYYKVARNFIGKVKPEDKEDFLHDLFLAFARVKARYDDKDKELTTGGLVRIAQYEVADYWRAYFKRTNGIECGHCSKVQKANCKRDNFWVGDCPKAIQIESLDRLVEDRSGDGNPIHELIVDDKAIDVVARLDASLTLDGYPRRFVQIAYKQYAGYPLTKNDRAYLYRHRKKFQKCLL
jgi:hypothetical protein